MLNKVFLKQYASKEKWTEEDIQDFSNGAIDESSDKFKTDSYESNRDRLDRQYLNSELLPEGDVPNDKILEKTKDLITKNQVFMKQILGIDYEIMRVLKLINKIASAETNLKSNFNLKPYLGIVGLTVKGYTHMEFNITLDKEVNFDYIKVDRTLKTSVDATNFSNGTENREHLSCSFDKKHTYVRPIQYEDDGFTLGGINGILYLSSLKSIKIERHLPGAEIMDSIHGEVNESMLKDLSIDPFKRNSVEEFLLNNNFRLVNLFTHLNNIGFNMVRKGYKITLAFETRDSTVEEVVLGSLDLDNGSGSGRYLVMLLTTALCKMLDLDINLFHTYTREDLLNSMLVKSIDGEKIVRDVVNISNDVKSWLNMNRHKY